MPCAAEWSGDGPTILTGGSDGKAVIWDAETGAEKFTLVHDPAQLIETDSAKAGGSKKKRGLFDGYVYAGFYSGGRFIVTVGYDGDFKRWDPTTVRFLSGDVKARREGDGYPSSLSPDGTMILTASVIKRGVFKGFGISPRGNCLPPSSSFRMLIHLRKLSTSRRAYKSVVQPQEISTPGAIQNGISFAILRCRQVNAEGHQLILASP